MSEKLKYKLPWIVIGVYLLLKLASYGIDLLDYHEVSKMASPDGKFTLYEIRSLSDGAGHAPYGTQIVLSRKNNLLSPNEGYVIFAGYCQSPISYAWINNNNISIKCKTKEPARTEVSKAYGIFVQISTI